MRRFLNRFGLELMLLAAAAVVGLGMATLVCPPVFAATVQLQAYSVSACPSTATPAAQQGWIPVAVDPHGNVCTSGSGGGGGGSVTQGTTPWVTQDTNVDGAVSTASVTSAAALVTLNTTGYGYLVLQFPSVGSGNTITVTASNDGTPGTGTTFAATPCWSAANFGGSPQTTLGGSNLTTAIEIICPVTGATMKVAVTTYGSGTVTTYVLAKKASTPFPNVVNPVSVNLIGSNTIAAGEGVTGAGAQRVIEASGSFTNITTATTTAAIKSGAGKLGELDINTCVSAATITVYDSLTATGTKLGTFSCGSTTQALGSFLHGAHFSTGLTIVTSGATDVTAIWY